MVRCMYVFTCWFVVMWRCWFDEFVGLLWCGVWMCLCVGLWWCGGVGLLVCGGVVYGCIYVSCCGGVVVLVCWFVVGRGGRDIQHTRPLRRVGRCSAAEHGKHSSPPYWGLSD